MKRQEHLATTGLYVIGTLLFSLAAIYNRFPLVYPDSGSYLQGLIEWHNLNERPIFYSILVGILHWQQSLWLIRGWAVDPHSIRDRTRARPSSGQMSASSRRLVCCRC